MSWGVLYSPLVERADQHVVKILRGAEPANLAVEEPTPFQFVVNLKRAKELGVTIHQSVISQANKVIKRWPSIINT
jgi:putative ABC transport system substrate-binding protein